jgi:MEMO1 family protein
MVPSVVRRPAVAGRFYPAKPEALIREVDEYLGPEAASEPKIEQAVACVVPHAGYMYSGHVAGAVYRRLPNRSRYIILCPNHTGEGAPVAIMSQGEWLTPLGAVPLDAAMAAAVRKNCSYAREDAVAHAGEHSLEVQLPFLQRRMGKFTFVPIAIGVGDYRTLENFGHSLGEVIIQSNEQVMIIASSDMNHYEPDGITREKDRMAIETILELDAEGLYNVIRREDISMCGFGPTIIMLTAAKDLGADRAELIKHATSGDITGDRSAVVGYAGIIVSASHKFNKD